MMPFKKKILIAGPYPEPVGGVSVHISRLKNFLENHYCIISVDESPIRKDGIFNFRNLNFVKYLKLVAMSDLVHVHSSIPIFRFVHCVFSFIFRKKIVVTLHSYRRQNLLARLLNRVSFRLADKIISVSNEVAKASGELCDVIPAFIPPSLSELTLSEEWKILFSECRKKNKKIIVSNAYRLDDVDGRDLYGFDQILNLFNDAEVQRDWVAILNVSSLVGCGEKYIMFLQQIKERNLLDKVYLFNKKVSFSGLLKESDAFIRATLTDGDALSIRESLLFGVRTIASDCVDRPAGTIIYKTSDSASLKSALYAQAAEVCTSSKSFEYDILFLYKGLL